ncbi:prostate androgen-regulated mucin-like protein 1 isoform X2 [Felis catus]|uniref:prostate androgen-regulated mucin-like protein 1 isoform X2 n=1 Tax=Felis catus TaxID=9685 RepID=UPI001D19F2DC|nr:prostate androgen-regulated mucin-like protein 1 isoform X2 [Felis catus]
MVCTTLFALCIFTAGLRVQSLPTSGPLPLSLPTNISSTDIWTSSPQSPPASPTTGTSVFPVTTSTSAPTPTLPKNVSVEPREEDISLPASHWERKNTDPSPTSGGLHLTPTPSEHSSGTPKASVPPTGSQSTSETPAQSPAESPTESPALTSPQAAASSPPPLSTSPPEVSSASSASTNHSSAETSLKPTGAPATPESPAEEHSSEHTPTSHATAEPVPTETTPQATVPAKVTCMLIDVETTASPGVIMQEVEHALSSDIQPEAKNGEAHGCHPYSELKTCTSSCQLTRISTCVAHGRLALNVYVARVTILRSVGSTPIPAPRRGCRACLGFSPSFCAPLPPPK